MVQTTYKYFESSGVWLHSLSQIAILTEPEIMSQKWHFEFFNWIQHESYIQNPIWNPTWILYS